VGTSAVDPRAPPSIPWFSLFHESTPSRLSLVNFTRPQEQEQAHKSSVSFEEKDTEGGRSTPLLAETPEGQKEEGEELPPTAEEIASA